MATAEETANAFNNLTRAGVKLTDGILEDVPIEKIRAVQTMVKKEGVEGFLKNPGLLSRDGGSAVAIEYNGKFILLDGNHRAVAEMLRGSKTFKAKVIRATPKPSKVY